MRVLFVDDQVNVLSGLRRMLRGLRDQWEMEFADSGQAALDLMAQRPFDVVVTDMRMPGMDGAQLLTEVMDRYPATVRIILSGQADQTSVMRAVTPAHQYLSKPCDAETLKATVARASALRATLRQESLIQLVSQVKTLPSLPHVYAQLIEELQSEDASLQRAAELISQDIGMTAKLMQMVNSSFFGIPRRVESPAQAAAMLGLNLLKPLVLSAGIFSQFDQNRIAGYSPDVLMQHSMAVSRLAEQIAATQTDNKVVIEDAMLAGLLHDVGQLLFAAHISADFRRALAVSREQECPLFEAEQQVLGATHADAGAYLLGLWGLSDPIVEAVAYHHRPGDCAAEQFTPLTAVHAANILINETQPSCGFVISLDLDMPFLARLGLTDQVDRWRQLAQKFSLAECGQS